MNFEIEFEIEFVVLEIVKNEIFQNKKNKMAESVFVALYDYTAATPEELSIQQGNLLLLLDNSDPDWTLVSLKSLNTFQESAQGLVPATYIEQVCS